MKALAIAVYLLVGLVAAKSKTWNLDDDAYVARLRGNGCPDDFIAQAEFYRDLTGCGIVIMTEFAVMVGWLPFLIWVLFFEVKKK